MVNAFIEKCHCSLVMPCSQLLMLLNTLMYNNGILWCVCRRQQNLRRMRKWLLKTSKQILQKFIVLWRLMQVTMALPLMTGYNWFLVIKDYLLALLKRIGNAKMFLLIIAMWLAYNLLVLVHAHFLSHYILFFHQKKEKKRKKKKSRKIYILEYKM